MSQSSDITTSIETLNDFTVFMLMKSFVVHVPKFNNDYP